MKKYFFLLILVPVFASAQCEKAASSYGNGEGADFIPAGCLQTAEKIAGANAKKSYPKSKVSVVGHRNILFVNGQVFAGEYTMLRDIIAVAFDEKTSEVAALESNGDVLIFNAKIPGNVAPIRVIRHQELDGATDVMFLPKTDEIAVHLKSKNEVITFARMANFFGREGHKRLTVRRQILNAKSLPKQ